MAEAAFYFVVKKLGDLVIHKVGSLQGVEEQVKLLKDELERMQCFLRDAAEKQKNEERICNWISEIREVAQDAEDVIETFILKVDTPRSSRGLLGRFVYSPMHLYQLNRVRVEIESIRNRLNIIEKSRERYKIENPDEGMVLDRRSVADVEWRRQLAPRQIDNDVLGLAEDVELLLGKVVLEEGEGLTIASIVGMGGIGKSTLARIVYNQNAVAAAFQCRAWVVVSREFHPEEIIKELMLQLVVEPSEQLQVLKIMEKSPLPHLKRMLHQRLHDKRYFIVLDDVWEEADWKSLSSAFPTEDKSSTLLLTSRRKDILSGGGHVHEMKTLDPNRSWELFLNKAFIDNTNGECPKELENIGREILRKCDGLPLAITVVGGLLVKQRQFENDWEIVLKGLNSHLRERGNTVSAILELSYQNLPPQLKSCFLCLGFFKEDATIRAEKLVQVWIAEGLIPLGGGDESMEEIGRSYLDELINRNMVQIKDISKDDRVKNCHIHDLLRELSITKAKEEINFEILKEKGISQFSDKPRHRSIYCSTERLINFTNQNKHLRSLFFHGPGNFGGSPAYWKSFELLRVLDFEGFGLENLPDAIGTLIGLRYLGLRNTRMWRLPHSLGELKNLQVLDIAKNFIFMVEVPDVIWKLDSLRHLYMSSIICKVPLKIHTLKNLQTLSCVSILTWWTPEDRTNMNSLRKLNVELDYHTSGSSLGFRKFSRYDLRNMTSLDGLGDLHYLTKLKLQGHLTTLPSADNFPPNLCHLSLIDSMFREDPMPVLEKLQKLLYLKLDNASDDKKIVISHDGFPRLKVLTLRWMLLLVHIQVEKGGMKELKRLETYRCPLLETKYLPEEVRSVTISEKS